MDPGLIGGGQMKATWKGRASQLIEVSQVKHVKHNIICRDTEA